MKKLPVMIIGVLLAGLVRADATDEIARKLAELEKQLEAQKVEMQQQNAEIGELRKRLGETGISREEVSQIVRQELDQTVDTAGWAQAKDVSPGVQLSKHIQKLKISGDARFRYERRERTTASVSDESRNRMRTRLRLGFTWQSDEGWEVGVGLASGSEDPTSTNDTWSESMPFETGDLRLDYAYAKHSWKSEGIESSLTIGQMKNPFVSSDIFWDGDVRPNGIAGTVDMSGFFATAGAFEVKNNGSAGGTGQASAQMFAGQLGYSGEIAENTTVTLAASYYHYNSVTGEYADTLDGAMIDPGYKYRVGDLYGEVATKASDVKLSAFGHVWRNFGAESDYVNGLYGQNGDDITTKDADDMDLGYAVGLGLGIDRFSFGYTYAHVEADSVPRFLKDSDFGDTGGLTHTDVEGHKLSATVKMTRNFTIGLTYMDLESIDNDTDRTGELWQLDAVYKF